MKLRTGLFILVAASALAAQSAPTAAPASKATHSKSTASAKTATTSKATTTTAKAPAAATAKAAPASKASQATAKATKGAKTTAPGKASAAGAKAASTKRSLSAKRDPFVSPIQAHSNEPINCGSGKRCLVVGQTMLQGIVKGPNGMIAVVSNPLNKAYFLHENDPVYNGFVVRITPDSVVFSEQVTDKFGKKSTREVVKKVNAPVV
jgi:hypothetical protein